MFKNFPLWERYLNHIQTISKGAAIGLAKPVPSRLKNPNPNFTLKEKIGIGTQVLKWRRKNFVMGPIPEDVAIRNNIVINHIFGVPKPNGDTRPILNLADKSSTNTSVNDFLFSSLCTVELIQFKEMVESIRAMGKGAYLWAQDLEDGYYNINIRKEDVWNLGFYFNNEIYVFKVLPMGLASSPFIFSEFMYMTLWAIKNDKPELYFKKVLNSNLIHSFNYDFVKKDLEAVNPKNFSNNSDVLLLNDHVLISQLMFYMDDIFGGNKDEKVAWEQFKHVNETLKRLNLAAKDAKSKFPNQIQILLGKEFDTIKQWCKIPLEKLHKYISGLCELQTRKTVTQRELLSHIGRTRHMGTIYRPLNAFARGLECWAYSVPYLHSHINISKAFKRDINLCKWAITHAAKIGVSFDFILQPISLITITARTDAALVVGGIGGYVDKFGGKWFQVAWSEINLFHPRDIVWRELSAIYTLVQCCKQDWGGQVVRIETDNKAVKYMLINMRSKLSRPDLQILINEICKTQIEFQFNIWMDWISTKDNFVADNLSRNIANPFQNYPCLLNKTPIKSAVHWLQQAASLCLNIVPTKDLVWIDDD